jgi:hypothetical protein
MICALLWQELAARPLVTGDFLKSEQDREEVVAAL